MDSRGGWLKTRWAKPRRRDGRLMAVARNESSSAKGINGDQNDNSAPGSGAVYIFAYQ